MSLAAAVTASRKGLQTKELVLSVTPSGNYANSGTTGDALDLTKITNPSFLEDAVVGYPANIEEASVESSPAGYLGVLVPGATPATWGLRVFEDAGVAGAFAELANGPYPAGVTAGKFVVKLKGRKFQF